MFTPVCRDSTSMLKFCLSCPMQKILEPVATTGRIMDAVRQTVNKTTATERQSTITCPACGYRQVETMLTNACQFFYDCKECGELVTEQGAVDEWKIHKVLRMHMDVV